MCKCVIVIFWDEDFIVRNTVKKKENLHVWPLSEKNEVLLTLNFT